MSSDGSVHHIVAESLDYLVTRADEFETMNGRRPGCGELLGWCRDNDAWFPRYAPGLMLLNGLLEREGIRSVIEGATQLLIDAATESP